MHEIIRILKKSFNLAKKNITRIKFSRLA